MEEQNGFKELALEIIKKNVNFQGLAFDVIDMALEPALKKVVKDSGNPFDDMLLSSLYPVLEEKIKEIIAEELAKI